MLAIAASRAACKAVTKGTALAVPSRASSARATLRAARAAATRARACVALAAKRAS